MAVPSAVPQPPFLVCQPTWRTKASAGTASGSRYHQPMLRQGTLHAPHERLARVRRPPRVAEAVREHEPGRPHQGGHRQVPCPGQREGPPEEEPHGHQQQGDPYLPHITPE